MKIPRNLPVGTVFILRNGARRTIGGRGIVNGEDPVQCFYNMVEDVTPMTYYPRDNGAHASGERNWDIIRIERIASAKPNRRLAAAKEHLRRKMEGDVRKKVDRDAAWLRSLLHEGRNKFTDHAAKRLRAIARRLENKK